jgi:hypothetical protein
MIRINLLPDEYRRSEGTPLKLFAAMLGAVILVGSAVGWLAMVYFGELGELEMQHKQITDTLAAKNERAAYHDALVKEGKDYERRADTIKKIGSSRMLWTEFMDQLVDVVNNEGNTARHLAWFNSIDVVDGNDKKGPVITLPGQVQGSSLKKVADFHEDLENAPFAVDVAGKSAPGGEKKINTKRNPPESFSFGLKLNFKSPGEWTKNARAKKAPTK